MSGRVAIVDDDSALAITTSFLAEEAGFDPEIVEGHYDDVDRLVERIVANCAFAICDHRLWRGRLASFPGARLVAELNRRQLPSILVSQYTGVDIDVSIRMYRRHIPVVLERDHLDEVSIAEGLEASRREIEGQVEPHRRTHRTLVRVENVSEESEELVVDATVPAWNPAVSVRFPLALIPQDMHDSIKPGIRLIAWVNTGALSRDDLYFENFKAAPALDKDDGLG